MTHKGFKVTARKVGKGAIDGRFEVRIDGHVQATVPAYQGKEAALTQAIAYVDDSIQRPDAYTWTRDLTPAQLARKLAR